MKKQTHETEKGFMLAVIELAKLKGWKYYHTYSSMRSVAGFPDLCMCRDNRIIIAELKTAKGKTTVEQEKWLEKLNNTPAAVYIWRPSDWELIEKVLR